MLLKMGALLIFRQPQESKRRWRLLTRFHWPPGIGVEAYLLEVLAEVSEEVPRRFSDTPRLEVGEFVGGCHLLAHEDNGQATRRTSREQTDAATMSAGVQAHVRNERELRKRPEVCAKPRCRSVSTVAGKHILESRVRCEIHFVPLPYRGGLAWGALALVPLNLPSWQVLTWTRSPF